MLRLIKAFRGLWEKSLTRKTYKRIRKIPIAALFFDFDYTGELWHKSLIRSKAEAVARKTGIYNGTKAIKLKGKYLPYLLILCLFSVLGRELFIVPLTLITAAVYADRTDNESFPLILLLSLVFSVISAVFVPFSVFSYIIYVETGIILFFMIKYFKEEGFRKFIKGILVLWIAALVFGKGKNAAALIVAFLPYAIGGFEGKRLYALLLLLVPFFIKIFRQSIVETGFFLWRYGFGRGAVNYAALSGAGAFKIFSYILSVAVFLFFWYVLRLSRSAVIKLFKRDTKNKRTVIMGLLSVVGFSIYTFLEYNKKSPINIILYLVCAALLKRTGSEE